MAEFRCISCGAIKQSEKTCTCPSCGYRMFESPFDRSDILKKEIKAFVSRLKISKVTLRSFDYYRKVPKKDNGNEKEKYRTIQKWEDDQRFPSFAKIQGYVYSSTKTEVFCERLNTSIEQIKAHINETYEQYYDVSSDRIKAESAGLDDALKKAMLVLGINILLPDAVMPIIHLSYSESPDGKLVNIADRLLESLTVLTEKIRLFIRYNNIYGIAYREIPESHFKPSKNNDYWEDLLKCEALLSKVLEKKYVVDVFSDGSDELAEMLKALWYTVEAILVLPVLKKRYYFSSIRHIKG